MTNLKHRHVIYYTSGDNPIFYLCYKIIVPKVPFRFLDKLKKLIRNTVFIFFFDTNNENGTL